MTQSQMPPAHPFDDDKLREECGVFGVLGVKDAANFVALGLHALQHRGQEAGGIVAHDPEGIDEARDLLPEAIEYKNSVMETVAGADAVVLMTEWNLYRGLDLAALKSAMQGDVFVDLRNVYERPLMESAGFTYTCVGR